VTSEEDTIVFGAETDDADGPARETWKILIVDDEPEIHSVTQLALSDFSYDDKGLSFASAYSGKEARQVFAQNKDIALILLDVVMESDDAGLRFVRHVREEVGDRHVRIVLRTGQPGSAPEREIVSTYDIDDYKLKTDLTVPKLYSTVVSALRGFKEVKRIEQVVEQRTATILDLNRTLTVINRDLTDSIHYARRIQEAILPLDSLLATHLPNLFVCYEPKDIVSGDFYWFQTYGHLQLFAAVDCTGHGVPGAFMSVLAYSLLNQVVSVSPTLDPSEILTQLDFALHHALVRTERAGVGTADGMDLALCVVNTNTNELYYAGARRPLVVFRSRGEETIIPGTRRSIGGVDELSYETHRLQMQPGETAVIYTDGITDQFGGPKGRKLSSRRFREFMAQNHRQPVQKLPALLREMIAAWQGSYTQTDDILVMGLQF